MAALGYSTLHWGEMFFTVASPIPLTFWRSVHAEKAPFVCRYSMIAAALEGPTPGSDVRSVWLAVLMLMIAPPGATTGLLEEGFAALASTDVSPEKTTNEEMF